MKLINTRTLELVPFIDNELPEYAILSHTWGTDEVTQQELLALSALTQSKAGFEKISKLCELALQDHQCEFAWVDTCCIDKTSSAELSEAINSMYSWYHRAKVCYAFLSDVPYASVLDDQEALFAKSRWFTRGWTLQELLAPSHLVFVSSSWRPIGTKASLSARITEVTGIGEDVLTGQTDIQTLSIACRMSWAASRNTTRLEDVAYCLMGIFDINMPMLYGEGHKAFIRLQEEIVKSTEDHTIFAWEDPSASDEELRGLLAPHPKCFQTTANFRPFLASDPKGDLVSVTNRGIALRVLQHTSEADGLTAMLNCTESDSRSSFAFIHILSLDEPSLKSARVRSSRLGRAPRRGVSKSIVVRQNPQILGQPKKLGGHQWFMVEKLTLPVRWVNGGEKLAFFTVTDQSAIRPLKGNALPSTSTTERPERIYSPLSDFLFEVPRGQRQAALSLHISARDSTGFDFWHHAKIDIGTHTETTFAIAASCMDEGDEEYGDEERPTPQRFAGAECLPATVKFEMEGPMVVIACISWKEVEDETIACLSFDVQDEQKK